MFHYNLGKSSYLTKRFQTGFLIVIALLVTITSLTSCQGGKSMSNGLGEELNEIIYPTNPAFGNNVTAHDPSIFEDDNGDYYTFGSHFAVTKSTNLMQWSQVAGDGSNMLYARPWRTVLADAFAHVGERPGSTWAPCVHKFGDKYYMYYSLSTFGSSVSYIGRVEGDSALGPYDNSVEIVKSDGRGGPNAIDPELFFDKEGRLWFVYGSFFAGIYIKEMHASGENIGLPKEEGYGKLLWQGGDQGPEGPFIFYNPDTDYYYLMASHGSLSTNYNMRVARSKTPDGPYTDPRGMSAETYRNSGLKLAGNYQFKNYPTGYAALGHNSVLIENGKYYVVYHSRYRTGATGVTGYHNQFVNQMFFNKNGWPVLAPNRYAGEELQTISMVQASREYDVLIHTGGDSEGFATSVTYMFNQNGEIVDSENDAIGTWNITDDYFVTIKIGLNTYEGVIVPQWNNDLQKAGLSISAYSRNGLSLWANEHFK
jgi:arabinan endo-1,5-alpha-L-arabinosidase